MNTTLIKKIVLGSFGVILLILLISYSGKLAEDVGAGEIVVIQDPIDGELHVYKTSGLQSQNFGKATHYKKSFQYWFNIAVDGEDTIDQSIPVKFYDGGHGNIYGSVRVDMPADDKSIISLHSKYGSQEAIEAQLIRPIMEKSIYFSGPLMSSKESYAEKKNDLIFYIEDQAVRGVYKTTQKDIRIKDPLTDQEKTTTVVEIVLNSSKAPIRQERSMVEECHLRLSNLSIKDIKYDKVVNDQIATQQKALMQVQTAIANAKRAEQDAITVEQQGKADAAKAKWEQEVIKAKAVTEAQQKKEVAYLEADAAEQYKRKQILEGQGDAEKKRLTMQANGALEQKLEAWKEVNKSYAEAMKSSNWVPSIVMGNAGGSNSGANDLINLLMTKTARDLNLDMTKDK